MSLATRTAIRVARTLAVALTALVLLGGTPVAAATSRISALDLVHSSVALWVTGCEAEANPRADDPDVIADLTTGDCGYRGNGSGTIIDPSGLILTNAHVVLGMTDGEGPFWLVVGMTGDPREFPSYPYLARPVAIDEQLDLALVQIVYDVEGREVDQGALDLPALALAANIDDLQIEDPIRLLGYPMVGGETITVIEARVSGFHYDQLNQDLGNLGFIKATPAAGSGVSGGTAVNEAGELIGVPTAGYGTDLRCDDLDGDGANDPATECIAMSGEVQLVRPIEAVHRFLDDVMGDEGDEEEPRRGLRDPHRRIDGRESDRRHADVVRTERDETVAGVEVVVTIADDQTGEAIAGGMLLILNAGVTFATFDLAAFLDGDDGQVLASGLSGRDGVATAAATVEVGAGYTLVCVAEGYTVLAIDGRVLAGEPGDHRIDTGTAPMTVA